MTLTDEDRPTTDTRTGYIAGLRQLADLLEQHPDLPLPDSPGPREGQAAVSWYLFGSAGLEHAEQKAEAARIVRLLPGRQDKIENDVLFRFAGHVGALRTEVIVDRPAVCERVVTGTREVTREVVVPVETRVEIVTETVEDVRWECRPLLAETAQVSA